VTLYHGGSVKEDVFGNVTFDGMHKVSLIFDDRPLFREVFGRARDELKCNSNEDAISVQGVVHFGKSGRIFRRLILIACEVECEKYVKTVTRNEYQCLDLVVRKLSNAPTLMCIQLLMCIHPLVGFCKIRRICHLLTLRYPTLRWIRKMRLWSLMLNLA
jgi:hypothetical protein